MALTKEKIINDLSGYMRVFDRRDEPRHLVESLLELMKSTLEAGEDVKISGFGKFQIREKKRRRGRNPQTGEEMMLRARRIVQFRCSGKLRDKMNRS
jgi:integration host factor subunit alpha